MYVCLIHMIDLTGAIRCRHESNVDVPGGIYHTAGLHQLPPLYLHQPEIPTTGEISIIQFEILYN